MRAPPSPPFPPPPAFPELAACTGATSPEPMSALASRSAAASMQSSGSFNYARPKQFIAAQNLGSAQGTPASSPSSSSLPSPLSPTPKPFGRAPLPPFGAEPDGPWGPSSPSPPPPPPPAFSPTAAFPALDVFPPPPPPLPGAHCASPGARFAPGQTPAAFLSSLLPSQSPPVAVNALGLPKGVTPA